MVSGLCSIPPPTDWCIDHSHPLLTTSLLPLRLSLVNLGRAIARGLWKLSARRPVRPGYTAFIWKQNTNLVPPCSHKGLPLPRSESSSLPNHPFLICRARFGAQNFAWCGRHPILQTRTSPTRLIVLSFAQNPSFHLTRENRWCESPILPLAWGGRFSLT